MLHRYDYMKNWAVRYDFLFLTDLHLHEWPMYPPSHSRLMDGVSILYQASEYMKQTGITRGYFGGDINHLHDKMLYSVQSQLAKWFEHEDRAHHAWVFQLGNHDRDTVTGETHCMETFKALPRVTVIEEPKTMHDYNFKIKCIPWMLNGEVDSFIEDDTDLYLLHHDFANVAYRGRSIGRGSSTESFNRAYSLCGHYHDRIQVSDRFLYAGAPMQHDWGDKGKKRGMYHVTLRRKRKTLEPLPPKIRFIPTKYPKFKLLSRPDQMKEKELLKQVRGNFVRVVNDYGNCKRDIERIQKMGARYVEPHDTEFDLSVNTLDDPDVSVFDFEQVVSDYITQQDTKPLKKSKLIDICKKAVRGVA